MIFSHLTISEARSGEPILKGWTPGASVISGLPNAIGAIQYNESWTPKYRVLMQKNPEQTGYLYHSNDLINFTSDPDNPIFDLPDPYDIPYDVCWDGSRYVMTYIAPHGSYGEDTGFATSTDMKNWTNIGRTLQAQSDEHRRFGTSIVFFDNHYYVTASEQEVYFLTEDYYHIKLFRSKNLQKWDDLGIIKSIGKGNTWNSVATSQSNLYYSDWHKKWILAYMGIDGNKDRTIGLASSKDIKGPYVDYSGNPVLTDDQDIGIPKIFYDPGLKKIRIFYRYHENGTTWRAKEATITE